MKEFTGNGIDVTGISLGLEDSYLLFINKKDGFLWMLKLEIIGTEETIENE